VSPAIDAALVRFRSAAWSQLRRAGGEQGGERLKGAVEALVFAASEPLTLRELTRATKGRRKDVQQALADLGADYAGRGIQLVEGPGGYRFLTSPAYASLVRGSTGQRPVRLSRAQLESLAIIAYRQPVTRPEIDDVRGVDSGPVLRTLLDRELIRVLGKKEEPGRPLLYGTTEGFLVLLGLRSLADLPTLREFTELTDESRSTYERRLGEAPSAGFVFDDEPDAPIDPTVPLEGAESGRGREPHDTTETPDSDDANDGLVESGAVESPREQDDDDLDEGDDLEDDGDDALGDDDDFDDLEDDDEEGDDEDDEDDEDDADDEDDEDDEGERSTDE
jgi:segregation and condensation protein B